MASKAEKPAPKAKPRRTLRRKPKQQAEAQSSKRATTRRKSDPVRGPDYSAEAAWLALDVNQPVPEKDLDRARVGEGSHNPLQGRPF